MRETRKSFNFLDANLQLETGISVRLFEMLNAFVDAKRNLISMNLDEGSIQ